MKTIYLKRNFSLILVSIIVILIVLYLIDYNFCSFPIFEKQTGNFTENKFIMKSKFSKILQPQEKLKCSVTLALILCQVDSYLAIRHKESNSKNSSRKNTQKPIAKDFSRQINQTLTLLKSLALQSHFDKDCSRVIILSDRKRHFDKILAKINKEWSPVYRAKVQLEYHQVRYPKGAEWMKKMFRPCATLRLFIPEILPPVEGNEIVVYADTDFIFLNSLKELKNKHFGGEAQEFRQKISAMAPCLFHYGAGDNQIPFYGRSGLNAGLMIMNVSRMRETLWTNKIRMVTTMFQNQIKLADQDILNIYFHFFPEELSEISCDWNFRPFQCRLGSHCEDSELSGGISGIHGNALSFTKDGMEPLFHTVFEAFHELKLTEELDLEDFLADLETRLLATEEIAHSECSRFGGFSVMILNRLDRRLNL